MQNPITFADSKAKAFLKNPFGDETTNSASNDLVAEDIVNKTRKFYTEVLGFEKSDTNFYNQDIYRARNYHFTDPLYLSFKVILDTEKTYGLFAPEYYTNSALAYFKRIEGGEGVRYKMLQKFIRYFMDFLKYYDFLITDIEGAQEAYQLSSKGSFNLETDNKLSIIVRETVLMKLQSIINLYNNIWYDSERGVEILPENLRRFDLIILFYNAGTYALHTYDSAETEPDKRSSIHNVLPTIRKRNRLSDDTVSTALKANYIEFNYTALHIIDAQIDYEESGKDFFANVTNDGSGEMVENNLAFTYRFVATTWKSGDLFGSADVMGMLAMLSLINKQENAEGFNFKNWLNQYGKELVSELKDQGKNVVKQITNSAYNVVGSLASKASPVGNAFDILMNPNRLTSIVGNAVSAGITTVTDKYVYSNISKINNIVNSNFSETMFTELVKDKLGSLLEKKKQTETEQLIIENKSVENRSKYQPHHPQEVERNNKPYEAEGINLTQKAIEYSSGMNVYRKLNSF